MRDGLSCRNQPNHLVASLLPIGMSDEQYRARNHSNRLPSLLSFNNAILNAERPGIFENQTGGFEANLVLCEIPTVLALIPFEAHQQYFAYCTYILVHLK